MTNTYTPNNTPNVVVSSPAVRKVANIVLGIAGLILGVLVVFDGASAEVDLINVTGPAAAVYGFLAGAFQVAVTAPNVPSSK